MNEFGKKVAIEAINLDMTMGDVRRAAKISPNVWRTVTRERMPTHAMALRVCNAMGLDDEKKNAIMSLAQARKSTGKFITFRTSSLSQQKKDAIKSIFSMVTAMDDDFAVKAVEAISKIT